MERGLIFKYCVSIFSHSFTNQFGSILPLHLGGIILADCNALSTANTFGIVYPGNLVFVNMNSIVGAIFFTKAASGAVFLNNPW
jgi:hypothetical protein